MDSPDAKSSSVEQGRKVASKQAFEDCNQHYKGALLKVIKDKAQVSIYRVGFSKDSKIQGDGHESTSLLGTTALITETLNRLDNDRLRLIWMVAQRQRAGYLLEASVERCIDHFSTVQKYSRISIPFLGVATVGTALWDIMSSLSYT